MKNSLPLDYAVPPPAAAMRSTRRRGAWRAAALYVGVFGLPAAGILISLAANLSDLPVRGRNAVIAAGIIVAVAVSVAAHGAFQRGWGRGIATVGFALTVAWSALILWLVRRK